MEWEWMKCLHNQMAEELDGACEYIDCALEMRNQDRPMGDNYFSMSQQEVAHFNTLDNYAKNKVKKLETEEDENYASMRILYDYIHEKMMDKLAGITAKYAIYKN